MALETQLFGSSLQLHENFGGMNVVYLSIEKQILVSPLLHNLSIYPAFAAYLRIHPKYLI